MQPEENAEPLANVQSLLAQLANSSDFENLNLRQLWQAIDQLQPEGADWQKLQQFGEIVLQVAELYAQYAALMLTDWEERYDPLGPPVDEDLLHGLVQRTMSLDISDLTRKSTRKTRTKKQSEPEDNPSIAQPVEKEKVLRLIDELEKEQTLEDVLSVAHDEDVSQWIQTVEDWMQCHRQKQDRITLIEIQQGTHLPLIKLWLALLLGQFELEQAGDFYEGTSILVRIPG